MYKKTPANPTKHHSLTTTKNNNNMKFLVVLACFIAASQALDQQFVKDFINELYQVGEKCNAETNTNKGDIDDLLAHKLPTSHEGKCLIFCFHKHYNIQKPDGSLDREGARASMQRLKDHDSIMHDKVMPILEKCADTAPTDSDPCEYAGNLGSCVLTEGKAAGLDKDFAIA